jgi:hypothetical protein
MRTTYIRLLAAAALTLAAACDSPSGEKLPTAEDLRSTVLKGDVQQDTVGRRLADTLIVRVTDTDGRPVRNLTVGWTVLTQGGGEAFLATVQTDDNGQARNFWNLGTRAGAHEMEVRAILDGQPVILDTIRATARPGAAASAVVEGDTVRGIARLATTRVLLSGVDQHGNAIPAGEVAAAWTSSATGVASVAADGTITGASPGRATVTATGNGWTRRVHVTVNGTAQTAKATPSLPFIIHGGGSRILGAGQQVTTRQNGAWVTEPGLATALNVPAVRVMPSGTAWALVQEQSGRTLWQSTAPGTWSKSTLPLNFVPEMLTSAAGELFAGALNGTVFRRDGDAWTPLGTPPHGPVRQVLGIAAASPNELYVAGLTQNQFGDGAGQPYIARWEGGTWTQIAVPAGIALGQNNAVRAITAPQDGGPLYAILLVETGLNRRTHLLRIAGGVASEVALPASLANVRIDGVATGPGGGPYVTGGSWVAYQVNGTWREHLLVDNWVTTGIPFVDGAGTVYVPAYRSVNGQQENGVIELEPF